MCLVGYFQPESFNDQNDGDGIECKECLYISCPFMESRHHMRILTDTSPTSLSYELIRI